MATDFLDHRYGNLQIRGIGDTDARRADRRRVCADVDSMIGPRNIEVVSCPPDGSAVRADLRPVVAELDDQGARRRGVRQVVGWFLFGLDDGRGDVLSDTDVTGCCPHRIGRGQYWRAHARFEIR